MTGIKNLGSLLKSMNPELKKGEYIICTTQQNIPNPMLIFLEDEGKTLIVKKDIADKYKLKYSETWALITLTVHSDLTAVGFLATITKHLAKNGISVNVVSAYYHDHLFVPFSKTKETMKILNNISRDKI